MIRHLRVLAVILALITVLGISQIQFAPGASPSRASAAANLLVQGAQIPPIFNYGQEILAFDDLVGKDLGVVMYYWAWIWPNASDVQFLPGQIDAEMPANRRPAIMITWEPLCNSQCVNNAPPTYPECDFWAPAAGKAYGGYTKLDAINSGHCDRYIADNADQFKLMAPRKILLRYMHEMNIPQSPWWAGDGSNNNDPAKFIAAWRHTHDIFVARGVTNVEWVWNPNYQSSPPPTQAGYAWNDRNNYYPGDSYVDWVGTDGYNWGAKFPGNSNAPWQTFHEVFDSVLTDFTCRYAKPQILTEFGSVDGSRPGDGTKAGWIQEAMAQAPTYPFLHGLVWYNDFAYHNPSQADMRVVGGTSYVQSPSTHAGGATPLISLNNPAWTNGYKSAISSSNYTSSMMAAQDVTPASTICVSTLTRKLFLPFLVR